MTAATGRSLATSPDTSGRGTPVSQRSSPARRPVRGRESILQRRYALSQENNAVLRSDALAAVAAMLPVAQRLSYIATYYGLFQAQQDAASLIGKLEALARRFA